MNETIKQVITCKLCQSILDEPVLLPCGETVCRKHTIEISNNTCRFCDKVHVLKGSEQFPANKAFQVLLEFKIKELDFGPNHKKASELVNKLNHFINDYNSLIEQPDEYISEYFSKQRNNVDLAREKLILKINQTSDGLISKIDLEEKECKVNILKCNSLSLDNDFATIKADLTKWKQDVKYLVVNDNLWTSITAKCSEHLEQLKRNRLELEESLLGKPCELETEFNLSDIFINQLKT
jgi:hypothetical protein